MPVWVVHQVLVPLVSTRLWLMLVALIASSGFSLAHTTGIWDATPYRWINVWARWDAGWYLSVVREGYRYVPNAESTVAFFPLYPLLMKLGGVLLGRDNETGWLLAGIIVSNLALFAALVYLILLARLDFDEHTARRAAVYLLVFPSTFFLSAVYPMSLALALGVAAFYHARQERWVIVGLLSGTTALARPDGVLITIPLLFEYLSQRKFNLRSLSWDLSVLGLAPLAVGIWLTSLYRLTADPWAFFWAEVHWPRSAIPVALAWSATLVFLPIIIAAWRLLRPSYAVFATVYFLVMMAWGRHGSGLRFGLVLFPVFLVLAVAGRNSHFNRGYFVISTSMASCLMAMFALWYFAG